MTDVTVTADANVLASGMTRLQTHPDAAPAQFIHAWRANRFSLVLSDHLLAEVDHALAKPYFARRLSEADRASIRQLLNHQARLTTLTVVVSGVATHPEDDLVLATALSGHAQFVVTGDHGLLQLMQYRGLILLSVHEFLATLPGLQPTTDVVENDD